MNKIIVFLATILGFTAHSNAAEMISISEECEVITIYHSRTGKMLFTDTLTDHRIIYTEKGVNQYAFNKIPRKFFDTSEKYIINNEYFDRGEKTHEERYMIYFMEEYSFSQWTYKRIYY